MRTDGGRAGPIGVAVLAVVFLSGTACAGETPTPSPTATATPTPEEGWGLTPEDVMNYGYSIQARYQRIGGGTRTVTVEPVWFETPTELFEVLPDGEPVSWDDLVAADEFFASGIRGTTEDWLAERYPDDFEELIEIISVTRDGDLPLPTPTPSPSPEAYTPCHWRFYARYEREGGGQTNANVPLRSGDTPVAESILAGHVDEFRIGDQVTKSEIEALGGDTYERLFNACAMYIQNHSEDYLDSPSLVELHRAKRVDPEEEPSGIELVLEGIPEGEEDDGLGLSQGGFTFGRVKVLGGAIYPEEGITVSVIPDGGPYGGGEAELSFDFEAGFGEGSAVLIVPGDEEMPGESVRLLVMTGDSTEGWLTLRAEYGEHVSEIRIFVSAVTVRMEPPVILLSTPEFLVGPTVVTFTIEGPEEAQAIFTGGAASNGKIDAGPNIDVELIFISGDKKRMTAILRPRTFAKLGWQVVSAQVRRRIGSSTQRKAQQGALPGEADWLAPQNASLIPLSAASVLKHRLPDKVGIGEAVEVACLWRDGGTGKKPHSVKIVVAPTSMPSPAPSPRATFVPTTGGVEVPKRPTPSPLPSPTPEPSPNSPPPSPWITVGKWPTATPLPTPRATTRPILLPRRRDEGADRAVYQFGVSTATGGVPANRWMRGKYTGEVGFYFVGLDEAGRPLTDPGAVFDTTTVPATLFRVSPQAWDFAPGKAGRVMISTLAPGDSSYYTAAQTKDREIEITARIYPPPTATATVRFRVVDPGDTAPYVTPTPGPGDNRDATTGTGRLEPHPSHTPIASPSPSPRTTLAVNTDGSGTAKVILHITGRYAGDNYRVKASLTATPSPDATPLAEEEATTLLTAWKRVYVEVDKMFRAGSDLARASGSDIPGQDAKKVYAKDISVFQADEWVMVISNESEAHNMGVNGDNIALVDRVVPTATPPPTGTPPPTLEPAHLVLKTALTRRYWRAVERKLPAISQGGHVGKVVKKAGGSVDEDATFYHVDTGFTTKAYDPAFVEVLFPPEGAGPVPHRPYFTRRLPSHVIPTPSPSPGEPHLTPALTTFSQTWFANRGVHEERAPAPYSVGARMTGGKNYFHLVAGRLARDPSLEYREKKPGAPLRRYEPRRQAGGHAAAGRNLSFVWVATAEVRYAGGKRRNAAANTAAHEITHQFDVVPVTASGVKYARGHCEYEMVKPNPKKEKCVMNIRNRRGDDVAGLCLHHILTGFEVTAKKDGAPYTEPGVRDDPDGL